MSKIEGLKILITEQQRLQARRDRALEKIGRYEHLEDLINKMIVEVTEGNTSAEEVQEFFEREDVKNFKK